VSNNRTITQLIPFIIDNINQGNIKEFFSILLEKPKQIVPLEKYCEMLKEQKVVTDNAIGFVSNMIGVPFRSAYLFPFIDYTLVELVVAYIISLRYTVNFRGITFCPANIIYSIAVIRESLMLSQKPTTAIELINLQEVAHRTGLTKIVLKHLYRWSNNVVDEEKVLDIAIEFSKLPLLNGYNLDEAKKIIEDYYDHNETKYRDEVRKIMQAYERIFRPYRITYT
jgi:hypothetical protein